MSFGGEKKKNKNKKKEKKPAFFLCMFKVLIFFASLV